MLWLQFNVLFGIILIQYLDIHLFLHTNFLHLTLILHQAGESQPKHHLTAKTKTLCNEVIHKTRVKLHLHHFRGTRFTLLDKSSFFTFHMNTETSSATKMCRKVGWRFTGIMATNIRRKLDHFIFRLGDKMFWSVATGRPGVKCCG